MKCSECDFESAASRVVEIHAEATHVQERIVTLAAAVNKREKAAKRKGRCEAQNR